MRWLHAGADGGHVGAGHDLILRWRALGAGQVRMVGKIERTQKAANLDLFLCMMQFWDIPHEKTMHAIDLFGKYVIPYFKKKYA